MGRRRLVVDDLPGAGFHDGNIDRIAGAQHIAVPPGGVALLAG